MSRFRWFALGLLLLSLGSIRWLNARPYRRALPVPGIEHAPNHSPSAASVLAPASALPPLPPASASAPAAPARALAATTPPFEYTDNFLLVGLDRRPFGGGAALADTILVAVFDEPSGALGLVSIPRDLWVEIPGHGEDRINTVMNDALAHLFSAPVPGLPQAGSVCPKADIALGS